MSDKDILLTGVHRSGTTLTCELLNTLANTVALDEPLDAGPWMGKPTLDAKPTIRQRVRSKLGLSDVDPNTFCDLVERFYRDARGSLLTERQAFSQQVDGRVSGSKFSDAFSGSGFRDNTAVRAAIKVDKPLSPDFLLVVKHNAGFVVVLEHLVKRFASFAIVRNPLAILASWGTVASPIHEGRVPRAERLDHQLAEQLDRAEDELDRKFILLGWFFGKLSANLPRRSVIRYEDIIDSRGNALQVISPRASELDAPLTSRNRAPIYDAGLMRRMGERLMATDGPWWHYYAREDVEELMR